MHLIVTILILLFVSACSTMPTVESLTEFRAKKDRLNMVTRNILSSNLALCSNQRKDYGFEAMCLQGESEENNKLMKDVYGITNKGTQYLISYPPSMARLAKQHCPGARKPSSGCVFH